MPPDPRASEIVAALRQRAQSVAVAESLTGGLLSDALTAVPGASMVFRAGLVVYTPEMKSRLAGVPADLIARAGVVSPPVAEALAAGARRNGMADWGVGVTGAAGPRSHDGQPPGTVCIAVASPQGRIASHRLALEGDRDRVRRLAAEWACHLLADDMALGVS